MHLPNLFVSGLPGTLAVVATAVGSASIYVELRQAREGPRPMAVAVVFD
jgi:hypothetical protein